MMAITAHFSFSRLSDSCSSGLRNQGSKLGSVVE